MNIAKLIDHTNIKLDATAKDIKKTCQEAKKYGFRGVDVRPKWVKLVKKELEGTDVKVIVLIDPPMGLSSSQARFFACKKAKKDGADELDVVMNVVDLKHERYGKILNDLKSISKILPTKVIIGSGYLTDEEIEKASALVKQSGAFCVKTATEKDPLERRELEEKARHLKIMKKYAPGLLIKASAQIRTSDDVKMMVKAGADIIGASSGVAIIDNINKKR
ncbi:MAG: deoxyribose-phosphate aldolase [Candidatus Staskawiczbacteria bacterium]|nr:deoxyribose-phosphate aldolase [Candidatus Staskawiczbacteria bacterium]